MEPRVTLIQPCLADPPLTDGLFASGPCGKPSEWKSSYGITVCDGCKNVYEPLQRSHPLDIIQNISYVPLLTKLK